MSKERTLLATGAHVDDSVFGLSGLMCKARKAGYRVVILNLVGDLRNWEAAAGREEEFQRAAIAICGDYGAEMRFLPFAAGRLDSCAQIRQAVAEVVAEIKPDIGFHIWEHDPHPDHVAAGPICRAALHPSAGRLLANGRSYRAPGRCYAYDNGPYHAVGFVPSTYVDITAEWPTAAAWIGRISALMRNAPYDPATGNCLEQRQKEILSAYRGWACGVTYAEAFWTSSPRPSDIL